MKEQSVCFSGHRVLTKNEMTTLEEKLNAELQGLIAAGMHHFFVGGALGFDTLAARCVLRFREKNENIRLILVFPCREQTSGWNKRDVAAYEEIKRQCDSYIYLQEQYTRDCMFIRNRYLVDNSRCCVCFLKHTRGGTYYTVRYAERRGLSVINLAEQGGNAGSGNT